MKTSWTKGLDPRAALEARQEFIGGARMRERLKVLLEDKIDAERKRSRASSSYESPSWALSQADSIGYERALFEVISLIFEEK